MDLQTAVSVKLINDSEDQLIVWLRWINHNTGCEMDVHGKLVCDHPVGVGEVWKFGKQFTLNDYTWTGKPWVFKWSRERYGTIGSVYQVEWSNGTIHDFIVTEDLIEVVSKASEAEPWLRKRKNLK